MFRITMIGLLLAALPATAQAEPHAATAQDGPRTATLIVTAADISSPAAHKKLDRRIRAAIEEVCGSYAAIESSQVPEMDACWESAKAEASQQLTHISEGKVDVASH